MNIKNLNVLMLLPGPKCPVLLHTMIEEEVKPKKLAFFKRKR